MRAAIHLFSIAILLTVNLYSQWQPDVRLTVDAANSLPAINNGWSIAASGNSVHTVWYDNRDGNVELYYKRSTDAGATWGSDIRLTNDPNLSTTPSLAINVAAGVNLHVAWIDSRDGNYEVYYKRSTNGGVNWLADTRLTTSSGDAFNPSLAVTYSGNPVIHLVWYDYLDGNAEIYYKTSSNGGISWGTDTRLTNNSANSWSPSVSFSGQLVHVIWYDNRDGNDEIYYKRSSDGGISWGTDIRLTNDGSGSMLCSIAATGQYVHAVWRDNRPGDNEIYYKRSFDGGVNWGTDTRLTNSTGISDYPNITVSGQIVHITWDDQRDGNDEIYYKRSTDAGANWEPDFRLTNYAGVSDRSSITTAGGNVHIVWTDNKDGNYEIYYKLNPTGNITGITNVNNSVPDQFSLSQNYPNPFNPTTKIRFEISGSSVAQTFLSVYDILGLEVATLVNEELKPGTYKVDWNGSNFPSGVYLYKLTSGNFTETRKMVLLK